MGFKALRIEEVPLNRLLTGVFTPRLEINERYVNELAESLAAEGQLKPIIVKECADRPGWFQVIDGEHRVQAARKLGWERIRAEVYELDEVMALVYAVRVNMLHGLKLSDMDLAYHIKKLRDIGLSTRRIAELFKRDHSWVVLKLRLVEKAVPRLREMVVKRFTKPTAAMQIARLPAEDQMKALKRIESEEFSVRDVKNLVDALELAGAEEEKQRILKLDRRKLAEVAETLRVKEAMQKQEKCEICGEEYPAASLWNIRMCANCRIFADRLFDKLTAFLGKPRSKLTSHDMESVELCFKQQEKA